VFELDREKMSPDIEQAALKALEAVRAGSVERSSLISEVRKRIREIITRNFRAYPTIMPMITTLGEEPALDIPRETKPKTRRRVKGARNRPQTQP
jgi:hypothetical protein